MTLDCRHKLPQNQLNREVANFVHDYDGPHRTNLLIVYYSGHGQLMQKEGSAHNRFYISGYVYNIVISENIAE